MDFDGEVGGKSVSISDHELKVDTDSYPLASVMDWNRGNDKLVVYSVWGLVAWFFVLWPGLLLIGEAIGSWNSFSLDGLSPRLLLLLVPFGLLGAVMLILRPTHRVSVWLPSPGTFSRVDFKTRKRFEADELAEALENALEVLPVRGVACTSCRTVALPARPLRGFLWAELALYALGLFTGGFAFFVAVPYSFWRRWYSHGWGSPLCSVCGSSSIVPLNSGAGKQIAQAPGEDVAREAGAASHRQRDTKVCPFCAEEVKAAAIKCKHCGSDLRAS